MESLEKVTALGGEMGRMPECLTKAGVKSLKLVQIGTSATVEPVVSNGLSLQSVPLNTLPVGAPPDRHEDLALHIEELFLSNTSRLSIHNHMDSQKTWDRTPDMAAMLIVDVDFAPPRLVHVRDPMTGRVTDVDEAYLAEAVRLANENSTSLQRAPAPATQFVRGKASLLPFTPGGMEEVESRKKALDQTIGAEVRASSAVLDFTDVSALQWVPPGFEEGLDLWRDGVETRECEQRNTHRGDTLDAIINATADMHSSESEADTDTDTESDGDGVEQGTQLDDMDGQNGDTTLTRTDSLERLLDTATPHVPVTKANNSVEEEWAHAIDITHPVQDFYTRVPHMAKTYPFELDTFQKQAILRLEANESVFVAAHTSAGKTVVAEYAIALAAQHMMRAIYTSPIKALSNQKFRDFKDTFEDVGLLTGDVQINPEASCLIMTTEILRSMLYRGADLVRDVGWVIFDEVHYINDSERGVVWEEVIIMLPAHVNIILLSATVPNTMEFAEWIGRTKKKHVYVISTLQRPVPLEHYLYTGPPPPGTPAPRKEPEIDVSLHKIMDRNKKFLTLGHKNATEAMKALIGKKSEAKGQYGPKSGGKRAGGGGGGFGKDRQLYQNLIKMLTKRNLTPCVIFTFSKKKCDENAEGLHGLTLTTKDEKSEVLIFFNRSVARLTGTDKELPQVIRMKSLLTRGIGVHHAGLLPIIKEMVEMLFARGLVKVLFATETFAMGVNMPARCVVFDQVRKFDTGGHRNLLPGEYIQMAGRAGRRGLDPTGTVILMCKNGEVKDLSELNALMLGIPTRLESQFRLTYNMILNLLRVETMKVEDMMKRSFSENTEQKETPAQQRQVRDHEKTLKEMTAVECVHCSDLEDYYKDTAHLLTLNYDLMKFIFSTSAGSKVLSPGRLFVICHMAHRNSVAVLLRSESPPKVPAVTLTVLVLCSENMVQRNAGEGALLPLPVHELSVPQGKLSHEIVNIAPTDVLYITNQRLALKDPAAMLKPKPPLPGGKKRPEEGEADELTQQLMVIAEKMNQKDEVTTIDPKKDLKILDLDFAEKWSQYKTIKDRLRTYECLGCPDLNAHYGDTYVRKSLHDKVQKLKYNLSQQNLSLLPEYEQRIRVLQRLMYVDHDRIVQLKGRVACEINNCDEVLVTELIFNNVLTDLTAEQIVALLSCMVFQSKINDEPCLTKALQEGQENIIKMATLIGETQMECGMTEPVDTYLETLKFGLVEVVYEWARGMPFAEITNLTTVEEGVIVRCIVRLDETCRDVRNAARVIGDPLLYKKMELASELIKRDIVFAASLYTA